MHSSPHRHRKPSGPRTKAAAARALGLEETAERVLAGEAVQFSDWVAPRTAARSHGEVKVR